MLSQTKTYSYHFLGLIILIYFVIFLKLDSFHMRWWDESMFAVNTYEMLQNGKYFSLYFDGAPDLFNTKPPLTSWIQLIFVKILGYNELSLRLPSALAAAISVIIVFNFISKRFNMIWAWLSALVLLTSSGFLDFHTARTGDSDALLTLFLLLANVYFLKYILEDNKRFIFLFLVFISLGFATKMFAAVLFAPAYFIILIQQKKLKEFLLNLQFLSGTILFLIVTCGLIFLREQDTPGYIDQILFKDAGRIFNVVENHSESVIFYFSNLFNLRFSFWTILLLIGSLFVFFSNNGKEKNLLSQLLIMVSVYLLIITFSITKLAWYDMPLYPYLSIIAAYPLYLLFTKVSFFAQNLSSRQIVIGIAIIFILPYYFMFDKAQGNTISNGEKVLEANEAYIFKAIKDHKNLDGIKVFYSKYKGGLLFYKYKLADQKQNIELSNNADFLINDRILICNDSLKKVLAKKYLFEEIDSFDNAQLLQIKGVTTL